MKKSFEKGFVTPLPVFIIATYGKDGKPNAMNAAWAGQVGGDLISISLGSHVSTENIKAAKALTVSFATKEFLAECDYVGMVSQAKVPDKFEKAGFTVTKSEKVNAPVIDQLPVALECEVRDIIEEYGETRVVAQIVGMTADESVLTDGKVDLGKLNPLMFDSSARAYREIGGIVGGAWDAGKKFAE
ncbi:NADH-FMN oxidoreductase RutF, flavin reductase (DIM6/NTAB) family [Ruminococcus sp. YE71]|uniref:flavin reductase family protein n=1 Tax=unclassified Ruminococcus TaxID=2608920 RepID=UPI000889E98D|nr:MULTISPECIES: flavin reductase family protein [unclassified Ruminococcus]SDA14352.1 NADH-FMN oxidoreductase RutF, flavin reductase (DIM6/NTAB) family [Ruminococcus sp. YE78]SFW20894.1 NADH-FMN oxidoreductase RutF, flavin reductase (DIM6/NTAB) family [Ruminococcus sp. YE71]